MPKLICHKVKCAQFWWIKFTYFVHTSFENVCYHYHTIVCLCGYIAIKRIDAPLFGYVLH